MKQLLKGQDLPRSSKRRTTTYCVFMIIDKSQIEKEGKTVEIDENTFDVHHSLISKQYSKRKYYHCVQWACCE